MRNRVEHLKFRGESALAAFHFAGADLELGFLLISSKFQPPQPQSSPQGSGRHRKQIQTKYFTDPSRLFPFLKAT